MERYEHCFRCDERTGRAGPGEDSLYIHDFGPFCEECFAAAEKLNEGVSEITRLTAEVDSWRKMHSESYLAQVQADYKAERESGEKLAAKVERLRGALEAARNSIRHDSHCVLTLPHTASEVDDNDCDCGAQKLASTIDAALEEQA